MLGLVGRLVKLLGQAKRHQIVGRAVRDKDRPRASPNLRQVVESIAHNPADRQPGIEGLAHLGNRRKSLGQD